MGELYNLPRESLISRVQWYEKKYGPYYEKRGLKNWKNIFSLKGTSWKDWVIFALLVMALFVAWAYNHDIGACREFINNQSAWFNTFYNQSTQGGIDLQIYDWGVNDVDVEG